MQDEMKVLDRKNSFVNLTIKQVTIRNSRNG